MLWRRRASSSRPSGCFLSLQPLSELLVVKRCWLTTCASSLNFDSGCARLYKSVRVTSDIGATVELIARRLVSIAHLASDCAA